MKFDEWLRIGMDSGWCGPAVCHTHDGLPISEEEAEDEDMCIYVIRLYEDESTKQRVEQFHSPSQWRKPA